jgi:hypothetical protein
MKTPSFAESYVASALRIQQKHDDPRDVVGVLVFVVGLFGFGVIPLLSMLDRLI